LINPLLVYTLDAFRIAKVVYSSIVGEFSSHVNFFIRIIRLLHNSLLFGEDQQFHLMGSKPWGVQQKG